MFEKIKAKPKVFISFGPFLAIKEDDCEQRVVERAIGGRDGSRRL